MAKYILDIQVHFQIYTDKYIAVYVFSIISYRRINITTSLVNHSLNIAAYEVFTQFIKYAVYL